MCSHCSVKQDIVQWSQALIFWSSAKNDKEQRLNLEQAVVKSGEYLVQRGSHATSGVQARCIRVIDRMDQRVNCSKGKGDQRPEEGAGGQDLSGGGQPGRQSGISDQWPTRRLAWPAALSDDTHRCSNTAATLGKAWLLVRPGHYTCSQMLLLSKSCIR